MCIKPRKAILGFTLVELMVALGVGGIVLAVIAATSSYSLRSMVSLLNYAELNRKSMQSLDIMTRDIRQMVRVSNIETNQISFEDSEGKTLAFVWDADDRELWRYYDGEGKLLLEDCDFLEFKGFRRNPVPPNPLDGKYDYYPADDNEAMIKLVQINWVCYRDIFKGDRMTTESVQTAKVVIRQQ